MKITFIIIALLIISGFIVVQYDQINPTSAEITADVGNLVAEEYTAEGFRKAYEIIPFEFPKDHGPHPNFRAEWWYYTGNLADAEGNRYGYQFTIFRRGIVPGQPERESEWATRQIYFAHFTVTDVSGETFEYHERYSRSSPDLAGAQGQPYYHVWIDDWSAQEIEPGQVRLKAQDGDIGIDLILEQAKPAALQGERGLSAKSDEPGNASYYYSLTNNPTHGTITTPRGVFQVSGNSWKDREWSTSDLGESAVGWDWFSLQLDDQREVMFYYIRREDGSAEPVSAGTVIYPDGSVRSLGLDDVQITNLSDWTSPHTGATYPAEWNFAVPGEGIDLHITPLLNDQELQVSFTYWEGAVKVEGTQNGYGYVELTGYRRVCGADVTQTYLIHNS
ncbi:lipocalin-like domain-containing protein [Reichenbachiella sp.]|uniref:lipocalin-like domain-containing protein n=1 Tax=Reichenbachiella sp. TaxID=2184521 RepID=UPI003B5B8AD5